MNYFKVPFTCLIVGPTNAGKSMLLQKILINKNAIIDKPINNIIFCYKTMQPAYDVFKLLDVPINFIEGLPEIQDFDSNDSNLLILDDLMFRK